MLVTMMVHFTVFFQQVQSIFRRRFDVESTSKCRRWNPFSTPFWHSIKRVEMWQCRRRNILTFFNAFWRRFDVESTSKLPAGFGVQNMQNGSPFFIVFFIRNFLQYYVWMYDQYTVIATVYASLMCKYQLGFIRLVHRTC